MAKVWFITGCSKGFGRALVEELLKTTDAKVVATARKPSTLKDLETHYNGRLLALTLDVTQPTTIKAAVEAAQHTFGRIDVLVNNAGYGLLGALEECSMEDIHTLFETNVFGLIEVTKAVLPLMRAQRSGHILNLSSIVGLVGMAGGALYSSTKFAVEGLSESMALELDVFGIKVTLIEPGPFRTDFAGGSLVVATPNPAYDESAAARCRQYMTEVNHHQPGDPVKAAQIMIQLTDMENPPLRMLLGNRAIERLHEKQKVQAAEFAEYEALARSADY